MKRKAIAASGPSPRLVMTDMSRRPSQIASCPLLEPLGSDDKDLVPPPHVYRRLSEPERALVVSRPRCRELRGTW